MPLPEIIWSQKALRDIERLKHFLEGKNPGAARRAALEIKQATAAIQQTPTVGWTAHKSNPNMREYFISFGSRNRGYIMRYQLGEASIVILRVWHSLEDRQTG